jgi:hypothetical protein
MRNGSGGEKPREKRLTLAARRGFAYIAGWQCAGFFMLILLVWVNEVIDLAALLFDIEKTPPNLIRGCLATAGVLIGLIVVVGNTFLQQKRLVSGMLTICSYCNKIRIDHQVWHRVEEYFSRRSNVLFTHGVCPTCFEQVKKELKAKTR